jgi:hypothetical protein
MAAAAAAAAAASTDVTMISDGKGWTRLEMSQSAQDDPPSLSVVFKTTKDHRHLRKTLEWTDDIQIDGQPLPRTHVKEFDDYVNAYRYEHQRRGLPKAHLSFEGKGPMDVEISDRYLSFTNQTNVPFQVFYQGVYELALPDRLIRCLEWCYEILKCSPKFKDFDPTKDDDDDTCLEMAVFLLRMIPRLAGHTYEKVNRLTYPMLAPNIFNTQMDCEDLSALIHYLFRIMQLTAAKRGREPIGIVCQRLVGHYIPVTLYVAGCRSLQKTKGKHTKGSAPTRDRRKNKTREEEDDDDVRVDVNKNEVVEMVENQICTVKAKLKNYDKLENEDSSLSIEVKETGATVEEEGDESDLDDEKEDEADLGNEHHITTVLIEKHRLLNMISGEKMTPEPFDKHPTLVLEVMDRLYPIAGVNRITKPEFWDGRPDKSADPEPLLPAIEGARQKRYGSIYRMYIPWMPMGFGDLVGEYSPSSSEVTWGQLIDRDTSKIRFVCCEPLSAAIFKKWREAMAPFQSLAPMAEKELFSRPIPTKSGQHLLAFGEEIEPDLIEDVAKIVQKIEMG